jgi:hypothetical protein
MATIEFDAKTEGGARGGPNALRIYETVRQVGCEG